MFCYNVIVQIILFGECFHTFITFEFLAAFGRHVIRTIGRKSAEYFEVLKNEQKYYPKVIKIKTILPWDYNVIL